MVVLQPVPGGLYDLALGPADGTSQCETCGLLARHCPGHYGHIRLPVPVFNPIFFQHMFQLLRSVCHYCGEFKVSRVAAAVISHKLRLLQRGLLVAAKEMDAAVAASAVSQRADSDGDSDSGGGDAGSPQYRERRRRRPVSELESVTAAERRAAAEDRLIAATEAYYVASTEEAFSGADADVFVSTTHRERCHRELVHEFVRKAVAVRTCPVRCKGCCCALARAVSSHAFCCISFPQHCNQRAMALKTAGHMQISAVRSLARFGLLVVPSCR